MDIEETVQEILDAFESEPEADYGDKPTSDWVRERGIRAAIWNILEGLDADYHRLEREVEDLRDERDSLLLAIQEDSL